MSFPSLSIVDAMANEHLFASAFRGESWDHWRVVLKAIYALPMSEAELTFFHTVAGDRDPPSRPVKEAWLCRGRGAGKNSIASLITAFTAALFDRTGRLRPGERALVACLACDREQARIVLNYVRALFTDNPALQKLIRHETAQGIELINGVDIAVATNNFRSIRGRSMLVAILDECAFYADETMASPDEELYHACRPALGRVPGSMLIGISSTYRKTGLLYRKYAKHFGRNDDDVLVIHAPSRLLNPTIDQAEIDRDMADDPVKARCEWLAEWRDDIGGWLPYELIDAARDYGVTVRPPVQDRRIVYRSAVDPSGGVRDSYTCAIAHTENNIEVLDCVLEIKPPMDTTSATERVAQMLKEYGLRETVGDKYAGAWVADAFKRFGVRYTYSERDRSQIYLDCLPLFTSGCVRLLDNQRLISQFAGLERRTNPLGKDAVDHGRNGHDDVCNAAALALISRGRRRPPMRISDELLRAVEQPYGSADWGPTW